MPDRPETTDTTASNHYNVLSAHVLNEYLGAKAHNHEKCTNTSPTSLDQADLAKNGVSTRTTEHGQETTYANGIVATITTDGGLEVVAPQGARQIEYKNGLGLFLDKNGEPLALVDSDSHLYVTHNGKTLVEDKNGHVSKDNGNCAMEEDLKQTFLPDLDIIIDSGKKKPLHSGKVEPRDFDDYGIERTSDTTRFPNGVEVVTGRADVKVPPGSKVKDDASGAANVFDDKGKQIAKVENNGIVHIYTADGTFTETPNGNVTFKKAH